MKEEEAKTKQCIGPNGCGQPATGENRDCVNAKRLCNGSTCMGWKTWDGLDTDEDGNCVPVILGDCGIKGKG